jgi:hypothetical protein
LKVLDRAYPEIDIEFYRVRRCFGPEIIDELSIKWNIPKNFMFIGSPGDRFLIEFQLGSPFDYVIIK